ncbi:MAG TPA: ubiquinone biosynthesis regulatory protein kinase UbiB [Gammaproteobacteria bacterium]|nr:ubiquinone biosynthesis regulatory protein kinase UbiB [Gammaproteobacteria bacterium]
MITPRQALRLLQINLVLARHGLDELILALHILRPVRFLMYLSPWRWFKTFKYPPAVRLRLAFEDLGPVFIKFGQALSTRRDLLPPDFAEELARLQDNVPPFPGKHARALIEQALGQSVETVFREFDETPLASASVAQVHAATLHDGTAVVVKVLRPNVGKVIRSDIAVLYLLADLAARYWRESRRLRPREIVAEYEKTLLDELDLMREAANASQLRRNFLGSDELYIPDVYWDFIRRNVMVMERIDGIPISAVETLHARGANMQVLAERGVEIFFTQVFKHNFFHADMHPGNLFIDLAEPETPRYIAVDFGIVGSLSPRDQAYLAKNFLAFFNRDYHQVAQLHVESGWVPQGTRVDEFESAIRTVCEPIFNRPLKEISFGQLLVRLFQTARRFNMEVQPQLVLLQKTLLNIEGIGRELYPELDLWRTAKPFFEDWMHEQLGPASVLRDAKNDAPLMMQMLKDLPETLHDALDQARSGTMHIQFHSPELTELKQRIDLIQRRLFGAAASAGFLIAGALLLALHFQPLWVGAGSAGIGAAILVLNWMHG